MSSTPAAASDDQHRSSADEDAFLTTLESKLRAPFSSMEVAKLLTPHTTLLVPKVLHRSEKVTQLRILTGLLGIPQEEQTLLRQELQEIVRVAQTNPQYEEWVRVVAGIVQEQLHLNNDDNDNTLVNEAKHTLETSCREIIARVRAIEKASSLIDEGTEHWLGQSDIHPTFGAFAKCMNVNATVPVPEHFRVVTTADILHVDERNAQEKAKEEALHQAITLKNPTATSKSATAAAAPKRQAMLPGGRSGTTGVKARLAAAKRKESSMFMPKKKTVSAAEAKKAILHKRKPGAAQALLNKGRAGGQRGGAKLKMMETTDEQEQTALPGSSSPIKKKIGFSTARGTKRKAESAATKKSAKPKAIDSPLPPPPPQHVAVDWRKILQLHSNVLTAADRQRVEQFFEGQQLPDTPSDSPYRVKLHEDRTPEQKTTFYLELDYQTMKSKQFSKIKKYT